MSVRVTATRLAFALVAAICIGGILWLNRDALPRRRPSRQPTTVGIGSPSETGEATEDPPADAALLETPIRVNLTPTPVSSLRLAIDASYRIRLSDTNREVIRTSKLPETVVRATTKGIRIGNRVLEDSILEIIPVGSPAIWINDHQYRGKVRLHLADGKLTVVNELPLHRYLASVVDSEMPLAFPEEARKAQAIVSRTYALYQMARRHPRFDLFATTRSQKYLGYQYRNANGRRLAGESKQSRRIVHLTAGQVCTHEGRLIPAYYSAVCGGETTPGGDVFRDAAHLKSVPCTHCSEADLYRWDATVARKTASELIQQYFKERGTTFGTLTSVSRAPTDNDSAIVYFNIGDGRRHHRISAVTLRRNLFPQQLKSPRFDVRLTRDELQFRGRGSGHGVGFCQWGARGLAQNGERAAKIVQYYYPKTAITRLSTTRVALAIEFAD